MRRAASSSRCSAAQRRVAARGARAAASACGASACSCTLAADDPETGPPRGVPAGPAAIGLDRRRQPADRHSLGARPIDVRKTRGGIGRARAGRPPGSVRHRAVAALLQATRTVPIVFAHVSRSGRRRLRREPCAAGRQCHWIHALRIQYGRKMAGAAQGDRAPA